MYSTLLAQLFEKTKGKERERSVARMEALYQQFLSPASSFSSIHVAGTNGKGSVSTKIARAYQLAGKRAALFTSPHLSTFRERIQINGEMISEEAVVRLLSRILPLAKEATFFEVTTLLALIYFAEEKVDVAVIEAGIGGRFDATAVISPILSVITSISFDHCAILGETLEKIAYEKAGIIKPATPVVLGPRLPKEVFVEEAARKNAPLFQVEGTFSSFDEENSQVARRALEILSVPSMAIVEGIKARPPCRMEEILVHPNKRLVLDVGHNPDGISQLFFSLKKRYPGHCFRVLCGFSKDKEIALCIKELSLHATHLHFVAAKREWAAPLSFLKEEATHYSTPFDLHASIKEGVEALLNALQEDEIGVICGSFFIMDEVRDALSLPHPRDPLP